VIFLAETISKLEHLEDALQPSIQKSWFYSIAACPFEYIYKVEPTPELLTDLRRRGVDLFTFIQRKFVQETTKYHFHSENEDIAVMKIDSYDDWWTKTLRKNERQSVKKAKKSGVEVRKVEVNEDFLKGVQRIYNETPHREGRRYSGYGLSIEHLREKFRDIGDSDILGAYIDSHLIGLLWLTYGDRTAMFRSFVSFLRHRNKCPNNALIAEAVRSCHKRNISFLVYGNHYGFLPNLDLFREHQGFRRTPLTRYFVPLSRNGQLAIQLGIHRKLEYSLPRTVEKALLKLYNPVSRMMPAALWYRFGGE
jgi:hypothetical protein